MFVLRPSLFAKLSLFGFLAVLAVHSVHGIGMPSGGGGGGQCCCQQQQSCCGGGGGGGFGGFGRRKRASGFRAAIQPVYRSEECPQGAWKALIEKSIHSAPMESVESAMNTLQTRLFSVYPDQKFFVSCADDLPSLTATSKDAFSETNSEHQLKPSHAQFISAGDGYCTARAKSVSCHVIAMSE